MMFRKSGRSQPSRAKANAVKRARTVYYAPGSPMAPRGSQSPMMSLRWLLTAASFAVVLAMIGAYAVLCTMFWQNQWEMIFAPSVKITATPASVDMPFEAVSFSGGQAGPTGQSLTALTGWWVPAAPNTRYADDTVLYLHGAKGSLSDTVPQLEMLHEIGVNVLAIDYHSFGASGGLHPTEQQADTDADAAWNYLVDTRHVAEARIVAYGAGAGASFATHLAVEHPLGGLILADISPTAHDIFEQDPRARLLPLVLLAREKLDPAPALAKLRTPKLFLTLDAAEDGRQTLEDFHAAAEPKRYADLHHAPQSQTDAVLRSFLDETVR